MKRIIQVGVGGMGNVWVDRVAASDRWEAVAYVDVNADALKTASERNNLAPDKCFTDLRAALDAVSADALLDVTPQQFRKSVCLAAFERGLHVMSEKPLADSLENAREIVAAGQAAGVTYMVAQNYRYQPLVRTARRLLSENRVGAPGYVSVSFHKGPHFGGFREEMAFPLVLDMSIHHFDMMRCMLDSDVEAVEATSLGAPWNWNKGDATISANVELANGVMANYFGSWVATGWETPWNAHWRFDCSQGVLLLEHDLLALSRSAEEKVTQDLDEMPSVHQAHLLEVFHDAIESGIEPETSGRRNLNSLATTYAVVRAARERRRVLVSELLS